MADRPFDLKNNDSVFASSDMSFRDGVFEMFKTVKDSHIGRQDTVNLAVNASAMAILGRAGYNDDVDHYAHVVQA